MMVSSRIFGITVNGVKTDGFVPYADMLNHKRPRQTTWYYSDEKAGFIIQACDDIKRGEPVYDSYGKKCNSRFFLNYGFINLNNDANEVPLIIELDQNEQSFGLKQKLINEKKTFQKFRVVDNLEEKVMREFISWCRYVEFDEDLAMLYLEKNEAVIEAQKKRQNQQQDSDDSDDVDIQNVFKGTQVRPMSIHNEIKAWKKITLTCQQAIDKYPTTYEEDLKLLEEDDMEKKLTQNQRNCVLYRSGEKKILHFLIDTAEKIIPLLGMNFKDARKEVNSYKDFDGCLDYVKNVVYPFLTQPPRKPTETPVGMKGPGDSADKNGRLCC